MQRTAVIVGAGPVGLACALSLAQAGFTVTVLERRPCAELSDPPDDGREIALTHASRAVLEGLGVWPALAERAAPLREARVLDGDSPFALTLGAPTSRAGEPLGWLVTNARVRSALWQTVAASAAITVEGDAQVVSVSEAPGARDIQLADGRTQRAALLVVADGRLSSTRRLLGIGADLREFGRQMLVCRMALERSHQDVAWEWFGHGKTLALLPLRDGQGSAVLTLPPAQVATLEGLDDAAFGAALTELYEGRFGGMRPVGARHRYPLVATYARRFVGPRCALIGDTAVGMHPVTAHGFNFGLQSQARLVRALARGDDPGDPVALAAYERSHRLATRPLFEATNAIATLYGRETSGARLLRRTALRLAQGCAPVRSLLERQLMHRGTG